MAMYVLLPGETGWTRVAHEFATNDADNPILICENGRWFNAAEVTTISVAPTTYRSVQKIRDWYANMEAEWNSIRDEIADKVGPVIKNDMSNAFNTMEETIRDILMNIENLKED